MQATSSLASMAFKAGNGKEECLVEDVGERASGFTLTTGGEKLLSVEARSVVDANEDMLLIVNALRWGSLMSQMREWACEQNGWCLTAALHACTSGACTQQGGRAPS